MVTAAGSGGPLVSRATGQWLARTELSRGIYHPGESLSQRISNWINHLLNTNVAAAPGGWWSIVALVALVVIVASVVLYRVGPLARSRSAGTGPLLSGSGQSARDHRERARRLAAERDFTGAIIESMRAIAVELEERGFVPPRAGRTAAELAAEARTALPGYAARLAAAARLFDDVRYGGRDGTAAGCQQLRDLDAAVHAARPAAAEQVTPQQVAGVAPGGPS
jgi:hypothetical protein